jgi:RNA-binding protein Musashi
MRDPNTGRSRGFAFLTFADPASVNNVMAREHFLHGKAIDPKRAIPRSEQQKTEKLFVRSIPPGVTQESFRDYFTQFGRVIDSTLMMDRDMKSHRGFGFVTYENEKGVEEVLRMAPHELLGQTVRSSQLCWCHSRDGGSDTDAWWIDRSQEGDPKTAASGRSRSAVPRPKQL